MTEEEKLQKAYFVLGLEPGAPMDKVTRRHKRLIMVWHPDRFPTADGKNDAEEELKQINNAKDDLKAHFEKGHKASGPCACKPSAGSSSQSSSQTGGRSGQGPGPGKRKTTQETNREEAEAQRRSKEREQKAAAEAAEKERQRQAAASAAAPQQTAKEAIDQTKLLEDERLRWKISLCIAAAWIGLSIFGWMGTSLKSWWHDISWKWERDHPSQQQQSTPPPQTNNNYVPPYQVSPYTNNSPSTSPFAPVGPPPTDQQNSPYSTLDSLNKQRNNSTEAPPPSTTTSTSPSLFTPSLSTPSLSTPGLSTPSFKPTTPNIFQSDPSSLRQRANDFLNSGSSSSSNLNIPYTPHVMPTNTPITPSSDVRNSFSRTLDEINKKSGQ